MTHIFVIFTKTVAYNIRGFDPNFRDFDQNFRILKKMFEILTKMLEILIKCYFRQNLDDSDQISRGFGSKSQYFGQILKGFGEIYKRFR